MLYNEIKNIARDCIIQEQLKLQSLKMSHRSNHSIEFLPQFKNPNTTKQDSPTSLNEREMVSSDENLPSSGDSQNLHKQMFNDDLVITHDIEDTEIFDQKFENSFTKEEPRKLLLMSRVS